MVSSPEESGHIMAHENVFFCNVIHERRSSQLADENAKCCRSCVDRSLQFLRLAAACSKIARTRELVLFTNLTDTERGIP